jgi:hypothetical protein
MQRALDSYRQGTEPAEESEGQAVVCFDFSDKSAPLAADPPFQLSAHDKRSAPRRRVLLSAIVVNREFSTIFRCQVRDVSQTGARLNIPDSLLVPTGFWLIAVSSALGYEATLAWRRYPNVGVSLGEPMNLDEPATRVARRLRNVWLAATN